MPSFHNQFSFKLSKQQQDVEQLGQPQQSTATSVLPAASDISINQLQSTHSPPHPSSYTKKIWKINRFKTEDVEKQSKLVLDSHNSLMSNSKNSTTKHGFRKTNIKPKVTKDGIPLEFLFVDCTPTNQPTATNTINKHKMTKSLSSNSSSSISISNHSLNNEIEEDKKSSSTGRVSRLFRSRSLKKVLLDENAENNKRNLFDDELQNINNSNIISNQSPGYKLKIPFGLNSSHGTSNVQSSNNNIHSSSNQKPSSLKKFYSRRSKHPKDNLEVPINSDFFTPPPSSSDVNLASVQSLNTASSSFSSVPITPINQSTPYLGNNSNEYFFLNKQFNELNPSNRSGSNSNNSVNYSNIRQSQSQPHNISSAESSNQILDSPIVNTPLETFDEFENYVPTPTNTNDEDYNLEICSINTSSTKKIKTLRRSNSIVSINSSSSVSQFPPSSPLVSSNNGSNLTRNGSRNRIMSVGASSIASNGYGIMPTSSQTSSISVNKSNQLRSIVPNQQKLRTNSLNSPITSQNNQNSPTYQQKKIISDNSELNDIFNTNQLEILENNITNNNSTQQHVQQLFQVERQKQLQVQLRLQKQQKLKYKDNEVLQIPIQYQLLSQKQANHVNQHNEPQSHQQQKQQLQNSANIQQQKTLSTKSQPHEIFNFNELQEMEVSNFAYDEFMPVNVSDSTNEGDTLSTSFVSFDNSQMRPTAVEKRISSSTLDSNTLNGKDRKSCDTAFTIYTTEPAIKQEGQEGQEQLLLEEEEGENETGFDLLAFINGM